MAQQGTTTGEATPADPEVTAPPKIGRLHEHLRRSTQRHKQHTQREGLYADYSKYKLQLQDETGLAWSLDASLLQQWGGPDGGKPALQLVADLSLSYELFRHHSLGAGTLELSGTLAAYATNRTASAIGSDLGVISAINDWPIPQRQFSQLTYTHSWPRDRLAFSIGQFPFSNFDTNRYLDNQQENFVNYVFSQNGSATYAAAGLGAYAQINATRTVQLALGLQYPNSGSVATLSFPGLGGGGHARIAYAQWTPQFSGLGPAQYSFTYYDSPATGTQPASRGWSLNAAQDLDKTWTLFGRANAASGATSSIAASYALGVAVNDPLRRTPSDQIGLAIGYSEPGNPPAAPADARAETIIETYWNWTVFGGLLLTPDLQLILDPALAPGRDSVWVLSLRTTLMF